MRARVASIASSWLSSPPVASNAGWKPAHPAEGLRSLAMSSRSPVAPRAGRRPAHPGNPGRMPQDSDARCIQIGRRNAPRAFPPQQHNVGQPGSPSYCRRTASALRSLAMPTSVREPPMAMTMIKGIRTSHHESITADCGMCGS